MIKQLSITFVLLAGLALSDGAEASKKELRKAKKAKAAREANAPANPDVASQPEPAPAAKMPLPDGAEEGKNDKRKAKKAKKAAREANAPPLPDVPRLPAPKPAPQVTPSTELRLNSQQVSAAAAAIDRHIATGLAKAGVSANARTDDHTWVRRVHLDIIGRIPSAREARVFLESDDPAKRAKLIDRLLVSDGHRSHEFNWLANMLRVKNTIGRSRSANYQRWIKDQIALNTPWNELVYDLLTAEGSLASAAPTGYLLRDRGMPLDSLSNTLTIFLGANVSCAQCHDHPMADWTQKEFFQLAAFFGATDVSDADPRKVGNKLKDNMLSKQDIIAVVAPNLGKVGTLQKQGLTYPDDYAYDDAKPGDIVKPDFVLWDKEGRVVADNHIGRSASRLRKTFASWLTDPGNPRFAAAIANRLWQRMFGIAVQEPIEDIDDFDFGSNPALLRHLSALMVENEYDLREFQRIVFNTRAYQATANVTPDSGKIGKYPFPGPVLRRMTAEQAWDSTLTLVAGVEVDHYRLDESDTVTRFRLPNDDLSHDNIRETTIAMKASGYLKIGSRLTAKSFVNGKLPPKLGGYLLARASELRQPAKDDHFLRMFGQSARALADDGSREGSIPQSLMLMNGDIQDVISDKRSLVIRETVKARRPDRQVQSLYRSFYSRPPTEAEARRIKEAMAGGMKLKDLAWVLFNTPEFLFVQ